MKKKKKKTIQFVISAHPGIDPGHLVPKSDTSSRARLEITVDPSVGLIRIRIQGKNFKKITLLMSPVLYSEKQLKDI